MSMLPVFAALGLFGGSWCFAKCAGRLDSGLHILIVILLFGGILGVNLGSGAYPIMFRDAFVVLPLYLGLFSGPAGQKALARVPIDILGILCLLLAAILLCLFSPEEAATMQILIGLKVWLYYIPFLVVGIALAADRDRMLGFFRQFLFWGCAACGVGLVQSFLVRIVGYERTIGWFFGIHAAAVTQGFGFFNVVGGIYRVPGTFSFVSQYIAFLHFFLTVAVIEANVDPEPRIRRIAGAAVFLAVVAAVLSGGREAIIFVPAMLLFYVSAGLLNVRFLLIIPIGGALSLAFIKASGLDLISYFFYANAIALEYAQGWLWDQIASGLNHGLLGAGIGSSTGPARYGTTGVAGGFSDTVVGLGLESYFAKAAAELGWVGFAVIALLMTTIAIRSIGSILSSWTHREKLVVTPLAIYLLYNVVMSFKGFVLDTDPGNIMIWISFGLMVGLARLGERARDPFMPTFGEEFVGGLNGTLRGPGRHQST